MDGNRRWATSRGLPKIIGHKYGAKNLEKNIDICQKKGIKYLTVYALSTENLKRETKELNNLFKLIEKYLKSTDKFTERGIRINIIGNTEIFPEETKLILKNAEKETHDCDKLIFNIALNYGGRDEIVRTVQKMQKENIELTEENLSKNLDTGKIPEPDLIIRTGGDYRLSNFLLWQIAYSEFLFTEKLWPDFNKDDLLDAIYAFQNRNRKFGGL